MKFLSKNMVLHSYSWIYKNVWEQKEQEVQSTSLFRKWQEVHYSTRWDFLVERRRNAAAVSDTNHNNSGGRSEKAWVAVPCAILISLCD